MKGQDNAFAETICAFAVVVGMSIAIVGITEGRVVIHWGPHHAIIGFSVSALGLMGFWLMARGKKDT